MNEDDIKRLSEPWRAKYKRPAWRPVAAAESTQLRTWFGGSPLGGPSDQWPTCAGCNKPMRFFLQLDLSRLPEEFDARLGEGLLQLFYCATDDGACETWRPFSGTSVARIIEDGPNLQLVQLSPGPPPLQTTIVGSWEKFEDTPHPEEFESLGLRLDYDFDRGTVSASSVDPQLELKDVDVSLEVAELISEAATGDKLGGWPSWVQSIEYPSCPKCDQTMTLLFQLDSEDNLPYMFGDVGCGHITQCPAHPSQLGFGWACS